MTALEKAIQAERAANKAAEAYDAYLFGHTFNGRFDAFKADSLAADAAAACTVAARLTTKAGRSGSYDAARAAEFRAIAGAKC